jgi:hypothetical protein
LLMPAASPHTGAADAEGQNRSGGQDRFSRSRLRIQRTDKLPR